MKKEKPQFADYKLLPAFKDRRGEIFDILKSRVEHVGMVTFRKAGIERGNHYHKKSIQYDFVISGKLKLVVSDVNGDNRKSFKVGPNSFSVIPPGMVHTYISLGPAVMIFMTTTHRRDKNYEKDTCRVKKI